MQDSFSSKLNRRIGQEFGFWALYARSALAGHSGIKSDVDADLKHFCLFLGYPRSGSTLIGSMLDAHPDIVIGHEVDVLGMVRWGARARTLFHAMITSSLEFGEIGSQWQGYDYRIDSTWQGRHRRFLVVGDKEAGRSSVHCHRQPALIDKLRDRMNRPLKCIHVIRNPWDNIATLYRRGRYPHIRRPLSVAIQDYRRMCVGVENARGRLSSDEYLDIYYDDMIADPDRIFRELLMFLQVEADPSFVTSCCSVVSNGSFNSRKTVEWSTEDKAAVRKIMTDFSTHNRFLDTPF